MESNLQNDDNEATPFYIVLSQSTYGVIEHRTVEGRKMFEKSIAKMGEDQFDSTAED